MNVLAIQVVGRIIPSTKEWMEPVLTTLFPALANNLVTSQSNARVAAEGVMETIRECVEPRLLLPVFCNTAEFGNPRLKPLLTASLVDMVEPAYQECPRVVTKYVTKLAFQQVSETKIEIKAANRQLLAKLYHILGEDLFSPQLINQPTGADQSPL